jgi:hypothetical protein
MTKHTPSAQTSPAQYVAEQVGMVEANIQLAQRIAQNPVETPDLTSDQILEVAAIQTQSAVAVALLEVANAIRDNSRESLKPTWEISNALLAVARAVGPS